MYAGWLVVGSTNGPENRKFGIGHINYAAGAMISLRRVPDPVALRPTCKGNLYTLLIVEIVLFATFC
jgi:hypothetical protein